MKELSSGVKLAVLGAEVAISAVAACKATQRVDAALTKETEAEVAESDNFAKCIAIGLRDGMLIGATGVGMYHACGNAFALLNHALGINAGIVPVIQLEG